MTMNDTLAGMIDHTLLKQDASAEDIKRICSEAIAHGFAAVCVNGSRLQLAAELLNSTGVAPCTVVGFPLGACTTVTKAAETRDAVHNGAEEIDMVINLGAIKDNDWQSVHADISKVVDAAEGAIVKVIIETCLLNAEEKRAACETAVNAGADFVKTSTGLAGGGAVVADIELMRQAVGPDIGVKASGGIRTLAEARAMINAGANRIGTSAGVAIIAASQIK